MSDPIAYVVKTVGGNQMSCRFTLRSGARRFADECACPVRIWRIVWKKVRVEKPRAPKCTVAFKCPGCEVCT